MRIHLDTTGTVENLAKCLEETSKDPQVSGILLLCADGNNFTPAQLNPLLESVSIPLAGGIFPAIIHQTEVYEKGSIVIGLPYIVNIQTIYNLSSSEADYDIALENRAFNIEQTRTLVLFVDGFATRVSSFIESLFNVYGLEFNYVGGGAGSLSLERGDYILTNKGMLKDVAVLAFLSTDSGIGVSHGWSELAGPFQVTESDSNRIYSIEWQPAFDFYQQLLMDKAGESLTRDKFFDTAKNYPFGIARLNGEQIVRDPFDVDSTGALVCIGEIQEGSFISILKANDDELIKAAAESLKIGLEAFPSDKQPGLRFFVDCISRVIVLGDRFKEEIDAVCSSNTQLVGVCSIGEIANSGAEYLELYNKTSVMAIFDKK